MKYFQCERRSVPITPILRDIELNADAWYAQTGRQKIDVQREALSVPIRGLRKSKINGRKRRDVHESRYTTIARRFPAVVDFILSFADQKNAMLGRAKIVKLPGGNRVYPHVDRGEYYARRDRYHLVLKSEGSWMRAGDEEIRMRTGELWWFDNKAEHEARNDSSNSRIHLIFDLEPQTGCAIDPRD